MSLPSIVSYGAAAKTSSLVWDGDLVIPDGYAIESASGKVGIVGDVRISGNLSVDEHAITILARTYSLTTTTNTLNLVYPTKAGCSLTGTITFKNTNPDAGTKSFFCNICDYTGKLTTLQGSTPSIPPGGTYNYDVSSITLPLYTTSVNFVSSSLTSYNFGVTPYQVLNLF